MYWCITLVLGINDPCHNGQLFKVEGILQGHL
jgi:hypothetical protein